MSSAIGLYDRTPHKNSWRLGNLEGALSALIRRVEMKIISEAEFRERIKEIVEESRIARDQDFVKDEDC